MNDQKSGKVVCYVEIVCILKPNRLSFSLLLLGLFINVDNTVRVRGAQRKTPPVAEGCSMSLPRAVNFDRVDADQH